MKTDTSSSGQSPTFLRLMLGYIYLHFGVLKFFPDLSPAELIATQTTMAVSGQWLDASQALLVLAVLECTIGIAFIFDLFPRATFVLFLMHMFGTFMPLVFLPEYTFKVVPFAPNVEGQYIFKNLVFVAAGWTVLRPHLFPRAKASDDVGAHATSPSRTPLASGEAL